MAGALKWVLELQDKLSGPATKMSSKLTQVGTSLEQVAKSTKRAETGFEGLGRTFALWSFLGSALERMAEQVLSLGKSFIETAIAAGAFKSQSLFSLGVLTRSKEEAKAIFDWVQATAGKAGFASEYLMQMAQGFIKAGATVPEMQRLLLLSTDVASVLGKESGSQWASTFARMMQSPNIMLREMKPMLSDLGIFEEVINRIAKSSRVAAHDIRKQFSDMAPAVAGPMKEVALTSIWQATQQKISGQAMGDTTEETSSRIGRALERIQVNFRRLFFEDLGTGSIGRLFGAVADALDPATESGKKLKSVLDGLVEGVQKFGKEILTAFTPLRDFNEESGKFKLAESFRIAGEALGVLITGVKWLWTAFDAIVGLLTKVTRLYEKVGIPTFNPFEPSSQGVKLGAAASDIGGMRGSLSGLDVSGIEDVGLNMRKTVGSPPALLSRDWDSAGSDIARAMLQGYDDRTGTHSPSAEWEKRGEFAAQGYEQGFEAIPKPTASRGGGKVEIHQTFNVTTGPETSAEEVAQRLAELSLNQLQAALDTAAQQAGAL